MATWVWAGPVARVEDLQAHTLIYHASCPEEWRDCFRHAGAEPAAPAQCPRVDRQATALDAARNGLCIAAGHRRPVVDRDVAHGRLIMPVNLLLDTGYSYFLVADPVARELGSVMRFRSWLLSRI